MEMYFDNKTEICNFINEAVKAFPKLTMKSLIGNSKSIEEATDSINKVANNAISDNYNNVYGTQLELLKKQYVLEDCGGCGLPTKYCRCRPTYWAESF